MFVRADIPRQTALPFLPTNALQNKGTAPEWVTEPLLSPHTSVPAHGAALRESLRSQQLPYLPMDALLDKGTAPDDPQEVLLGRQDSETPLLGPSRTTEEVTTPRLDSSTLLGPSDVETEQTH